MSLRGSDIAKQLALVDEQERKLAIQKQLTLEKAFKSGDVDAIYKAENYYSRLAGRNQENRTFLNQPFRLDGMKSIVLDPMESASSMGYFSKSTTLNYSILRAMGRAPIISAIVKKRLEQIAEYLKVQPDKYSKGFLIKKVGKTEEEYNDNDKRAIDKLSEFILFCGDDDRKWDMDNFGTFVKKFMSDSLILDQATFEVVPNRAGIPTQFIATDGATFRLADTYDNDSNIMGRKKVNGYYPSYVQIYLNQIVADFYPWELCFGIRNPSSNIYQNGYGRSELEDLVSTVTAMLNADAYNANNFKNGSSPAGALMVKKGNLNKDKIEELRRDWSAQFKGVAGAHKTAILDAEAIEWVDWNKSNRDMEYSAFQEYLIKLACANYKISPEEIGFPMKGSSGGSIISNDKGGGKAEKDYSKESGLKPLLTQLQEWINTFIIYPKTNKAFEFQFVGMDAESAAQEEERILKAATIYITPNDIRKAKKMSLFKEDWADRPLNPIIAQSVQMKDQFGQEQQQKEQEEQDNQYNNTNPFLDEVDKDGKPNPFAKSFNDLIKTEYFT